YFYDDAASRFYLVMKYISGGDLLARLRNAQAGRLDEKTVTDWGLQVVDVLDYLHRRNPPIIYRDLKPANLMIDGNSGRIMLIDFGIARWVAPQEKGVTAVGTMGYAPPELFGGKAEPRTDIYSLGATMFHLLTGQDPQDGDGVLRVRRWPHRGRRSLLRALWAAAAARRRQRRAQFGARDSQARRRGHN